tara:strand:+ start:8059 stop:9885 length:1827 start_codon:yes stop_codon:yes gene_type:complete
MCGFFGNIFNKSYSRNIKKFLISANFINHRGPDDSFFFNEKNLDLKFYRLSIRDLSKLGRQPMISKNKKYLISFNGEIYNSDFLKKKYLTDQILKSNSDTEVLLEVFSKKGMSFLDDLEGMFSIFFYEFKKKKAFLVRDRFGIKPLYFKSNNNNILFSSEIKPIVNFSSKNKFSNEGIADFFLKGCLDHNKTLFNDISSVDPGSFIEINNCRIIRSKNYWFLKEKKIKENLYQTEKKLKNLFQSSIKKHLISDRKIGLFLSGGTDSTILANQISQLIPYKLETFTYDFKNSGKFGEKFIAKKIANKIKVKNYSEIVDANYLISNFKKLIETVESPITSIRLFGVLKNYERAKEKNYKVIIEGHGGDEIFGGYAYNYIFHVLNEFKKNNNKIKLVKSLIFNNFFKKKKLEEIYKILITSTFQNGSTTDGTPFVNLNFFNKEFLDDVINEDYYFEKSLSKNLLKDSQYKDINSIKLPRVLKYTDRLAMINGIETRVPFLDHKFFEYGFNLRNDLKFKKDTARWIFKKIFKTKKYSYYNKRSIVDPQTLWFKKELKDFTMDVLNSKEIKSSYYFNHKYIKKYYENFIKNSNSTSFNLIQILSAQIYFNSFK